MARRVSTNMHVDAVNCIKSVNVIIKCDQHWCHVSTFFVTILTRHFLNGMCEVNACLFLDGVRMRV